MPVSEQARRNAEIRAEHAARLADDGIVLACRECALDGHTDSEEPVLFYPSQQETFKTMVRRSGLAATDLLRRKLRDPKVCRLLCQHHARRAAQGWTTRREAIYREWPEVANMRGAYEVVAPDGKTVQVDEYGLGPYAWEGLVEYFRKLRAEWFDDTDGTPPEVEYN